MSRYRRPIDVRRRDADYKHHRYWSNPDYRLTVSLCREHHAEQHRVGEIKFWAFIGKRDPRDLIAEFIKASPKRHEIEQIQRERGDSLTSARAAGR